MRHSRLDYGFFALLITGLITTQLEAAFITDGYGTRPVGMGGAFTAISDDSNAPMYNPAGLVQVQWNEMSAMYERLFSGITLYSGNDQVNLDQSYLSYVARPTRFGSFGISWANFDTTHLYREDTVLLTYARNVGDFLPALDNELSVGVNLKYLHRGISLDSLTANDPVFSAGDTASAVTGDVGLLFKPDDGPLSGWRFGVTGQNLTSPNVGFGDTDDVPLEWRAGVAYQSRSLPWLVPDVDVTRSAGVTGVAAGVESWLFHDTFGLRAGINNDQGTAGLSYYQAMGKKLGFRLDYGLVIPFYVEGTSGDQTLQLTIYF